MSKVETPTEELQAILESVGVEFGWHAMHRDKGDTKSPIAFAVTVSHLGQRITTEFSYGVGHAKIPPQVRTVYEHERACAAIRAFMARPPATFLADVVGHLLAFASSAEGTFEDWCADLGESEDSRKAHAAWLLYHDANIRLRRMLGDRYEAACQVAGEM